MYHLLFKSLWGALIFVTLYPLSAVKIDRSILFFSGYKQLPYKTLDERKGYNYVWLDVSIQAGISQPCTSGESVRSGRRPPQYDNQSVKWHTRPFVYHAYNVCPRFVPSNMCLCKLHHLVRASALSSVRVQHTRIMQGLEHFFLDISLTCLAFASSGWGLASVSVKPCWDQKVSL